MLGNEKRIISVSFVRSDMQWSGALVEANPLKWFKVSISYQGKELQKIIFACPTVSIRVFNFKINRQVEVKEEENHRETRIEQNEVKKIVSNQRKRKRNRELE